MSKFFRALAFVVAVCCTTWVGVLWWWQRSGHSIEMQDVVIYLCLLPLVLMLLLLALRWAWQRSAVSAIVVPVVPGVPGEAAAAVGGSGIDAASASEAQARHATVQLVHAASCTVAGDQLSELLDAAAAGKPLPRPDGELLNDDGLPVLCARMPDNSLPLEAVQTDLVPLLPVTRQQQPEWAAQEPGEHVLRSLAALREPLMDQQRWLASLDQALKSTPSDGGEGALPRPPLPRTPQASLRVLLGWPVHWSAFEQALARRWAEWLLSSGDNDLSAIYGLSCSTLAGTGEDLWLRVDQFSQPASRTDWLLVAACHSDLDPSRVDALATAQRLFDPVHRPGGRIPGEAAAALLLAPAEWKAPEGMEAPTVWLHRPALSRRDKPVEAAGRVGHQDLAEAMSQALQAAQLEGPAVAALVCDADQHSQRTSELYGAVVDALPHLDPVEDMRVLGKVTGYTGVASWLLVLAGAAETAKSGRFNTLALGLSDSLLRIALVVKPREEADVST